MVMVTALTGGDCAGCHAVSIVAGAVLPSAVSPVPGAEPPSVSAGRPSHWSALTLSWSFL